MFYRADGFADVYVYKYCIHTTQGTSRLYTSNMCGLLYNCYPTELFLKEIINT